MGGAVTFYKHSMTAKIQLVQLPCAIFNTMSKEKCAICGFCKKNKKKSLNICWSLFFDDNK